MSTATFSQLLLVCGLFTVTLVFGMWILARFSQNRFPGGIHFRRDRALLSFPFVSSIALGVVVTVLLNLFLRI